MRKTLVLLTALVLGAGAPTRDAHATSLVALTTDQLVDASDYIVKGTVEEVWTDLDQADHIWTRARVRVETAFKGAPGETIVVSQPGGILGPMAQRVASPARFSEGEEAYFFLEDLGPATTVVGMVQGKYTLRMDPRLREEIVVRFTRPSDEVYDARFLPLPELDNALTAKRFEQDIQARLALGWDGQPIPGARLERLQAINKLQPGVSVIATPEVTE